MPRFVATPLFIAMLVMVAFVAVGGANASTIPNDDYPGTTIGAVPFSDALNTEGATTEPGEPVGSCLFDVAPEATVWYNYTPSEDLILRADTLGSDYDTIVAVWTESVFPGGGLAEVACSDDITFEGDSGQAFDAEAGRTYHIQAGGYPTTTPTGNLVVNLNAVVPPPNDDIADAIHIDSLPFGDSTDNGAASLEPMEPVPSCSFGFPVQSTLWYTFTPDTDGPLILETIGSAFDSIVAIYTGAPGALTEAACNDDGAYFSLASRLGFEAEAGTTYYIQVGGLAGFAVATGVLEFSVDTLEIPDCTLTGESFSDPEGDSMAVLRPTFDIVDVRAGSDDENMCLRVEFAEENGGGAEEPAGGLFSTIALDTDQDASTGFESIIDFLCETPSGLGQDAEVQVLPGTMTAPMLVLPEEFFPASPIEFPDFYGITTIDENAFSVRIPLEAIGDGEMNIALLVANSLEIADCAPDEGHISIPIAGRLQGDVDCDEDTDAVDAQKVLAQLAGLPVNLPDGCAGPGMPASAAPIVGDVDCDGDVDSVDALKILRHIAGLPVQQDEPCPNIGDPLARKTGALAGPTATSFWRELSSGGRPYASKGLSAWASSSGPARPAP